MTPGDREHPSTLTLIKWPGENVMPVIRYSAVVLTGIAETVLSGYRRTAWGGVETGGVLFGTNHATGVWVCAYRVLECEHLLGPAFELGDKDFTELERLLAAGDAAGDADEQLKGLTPVGWFHSVSRRDLCVTDHDRRLHDRFFPASWQVAMVLKRQKSGPLAVGFFSRDPTRSLERHSPPLEFAIDDFQLRVSELPAADLEPNVEEMVAAHSDPATEDVAMQHATPKSELLVFPTHAESPYEFFGLALDPFSPTPDPRFFYPAPQHRDALAVLMQGIQIRRGFMALIGDAGMGKSLVLESLIEQMKAQSLKFSFLFNSKITPDQLFELLAEDLSLKYQRPTKTSILIALNEYLLERSQQGQTTVLIVDNAQKLRPDVLEEVELLGNLENRRGKLLQVVFAAQPTFEQQLERTELRALRQRLLMRARLSPFTGQQATAYVESRLAKAGLVYQGIFPTEILSEIHLRTRGIPRLINAVCGGLLQFCLHAQSKTATVGMVDRIGAELELEALHRSADQDSQSGNQVLSA